MGRARGKGAVYSNTYDEETIDKALHVLAMQAGNSRAAERALRDEGYTITAITLRTWAREKHVERYIQATKNVRSFTEGRAAADALETHRRAHEAIDIGITQLLEALEERKIPPKQLAADIRNLSVVGGIEITKHGELTGRPIVHEHRRSPEELLRSLMRDHPDCVDGSAEEIRSLPENTSEAA